MAKCLRTKFGRFDQTVSVHQKQLTLASIFKLNLIQIPNLNRKKPYSTINSDLPQDLQNEINQFLILVDFYCGSEYILHTMHKGISLFIGLALSQKTTQVSA